MATKTFEELKQMAIQIRDEKTNKQNTATIIGTQMLEHLNKLEQEYYDKTTLDKRVTELNISELYKTQGSGGTNRYTLETAIAQVEETFVPDVDDKNTMCAFAAAISLVENGVPAVMADVESGWKLL